MKHFAVLFLTLLGLLLPTNILATKNTFSPVEGLIARRVPWLAGKIDFVQTKGKADAFTLTARGGRPVIEADNALSAAVGLNWYLKYYCHRQMSHLGDNLPPVDTLPLPQKNETHNCQTPLRYALNYCTQNYTFSFYTWEDWERELDWMALHGVNLMLICTGEEAVWQNTLRRLGYSEKEISEFLPGPAYTAWWLMGNIEGCGGPMPQSLIDARAALTRRILKRMNDFGMEPVLPGFYGMVPTATKQHTKARIVAQGGWCGLTRPDFLVPTDPEFARMAKVFYEETRKLYGSRILYFSGDPFHEGGQTAGVDIAEAGRLLQQAMLRAYPRATWVLQGWQGNPRPQLIAKMDKRHLLIQELYGSQTADWEQRHGYEETPFIWCDIANFGERPGFCGKLERLAAEWQRVLNSPYHHLLRGIGIMPEGIRNNPVTYELILELPWHEKAVDVSSWLTGYTWARYGRRDTCVEAAWRDLLTSVYASHNPQYPQGPYENILMARPDRAPTHCTSLFSSAVKSFDVARFARGVNLFLSATLRFPHSATFLSDALQMQSGLISCEADSSYAQLQRALARRDSVAFDYHAAQMLLQLDATDRLMNQSELFRLETYVNQALRCSATPAERRCNLSNMLAHITYWGGENPASSTLSEYAYKEWSGLIRSFYKPRWQSYFDYCRALMCGEQTKAPDYGRHDRQWVHQMVEHYLKEP